MVFSFTNMQKEITNIVYHTDYMYRVAQKVKLLCLDYSHL